MLWHVGAQTVLPPGYLCCGYPQTASGNHDKGPEITTDNRVLFHRVANTLNYLDIKTVIVSCGTCMDQLQKYQFEKIFPVAACSTFTNTTLERASKLEGDGTRYMYHDPCHTPIKTQAPMKVVNGLMGQDVALNDRCCGEGAVRWPSPGPTSRRRYASAKEGEMRKGADALRAIPVKSADGSEKKFDGDVKILTSCRAACGGCRATTMTPAPPPITSWWRWRSICSAKLDGRVRRARQQRRH